MVTKMARKLYITPEDKKIMVDTESDIELYRVDDKHAPYSMRETFFRVMLHESNNKKYFYLREVVNGNIEFSDTLWREEGIIRIIQQEMSDPLTSEKNWVTGEEQEKLLSVGIDVFEGVDV